jgi:hypothetical protein
MNSNREKGKGKRTNLAAVIIGVALGVVIVLGVIFLLQRISTVSWRIYASEEYGYEISHPGDWEITVAIPRDEWDMVWDNLWEDLQGDEIEKITFQEVEYEIWAGYLQIRVLQKPEELDLGTWLDDHVRELTAGGNRSLEVQDTTLGGREAKRIVVEGMGYEEHEWVTLLNGNICMLFFIAKSPNDPEVDRHREIYDHMVGSFRFTG